MNKELNKPNNDVERLVGGWVEESKLRLEVMTNPYTGINPSGKETRRARRKAERNAKKKRK